MDYSTAEARLQDMRLDAYDGVLRCFRDKSLNISAVLRETIVTKLRLEFGITPEMHTEILARAIQDESHPPQPSRGYAAPEPPSKTQPVRKAKASAGPKRAGVLDLNAHLPAPPVQAVALTYNPSNADGATGRKRKVTEVNFRKVQRWWPNEGGWWDAVVTKYNPDTGVCELVYGFGTNKAVFKEMYNMHTCTQDHCILTNDYASQSDIKKWKMWN